MSQYNINTLSTTQRATLLPCWFETELFGKQNISVYDKRHQDLPDYEIEIGFE